MLRNEKSWNSLTSIFTPAEVRSAQRPPRKGAEAARTAQLSHSLIAVPFCACSSAVYCMVAFRKRTCSLEDVGLDAASANEVRFRRRP